MQLIDTHVHLNFDVFQGELSGLSARWRKAGVVHLVHSCVEPAEFEGIRMIASQIPELSLSVGLHPLDAQKWQGKEEISTLATSTEKVVAIGEMGLDFYKADNIEQQKEVFIGQLEIASSLDKPVIIHCRDAQVEMRSMLQDWQKNNSPVRGVMHCWGGNVEETKWFLDLGFYISFSGIVTFKNAHTVQESASYVPSDRLLIETDCPFLAPSPKRGKRNEPSFVRYVAEKVADLRNESVETIAKKTTENAIKLFHLSVKTQRAREN